MMVSNCPRCQIVPSPNTDILYNFTTSQQILNWFCLIAIDVWGISVFREGIVIAGSVMIVMVAVIAVSSDFLRIIRDLDLLPVLIWQAFPHNTCAL